MVKNLILFKHPIWTHDEVLLTMTDTTGVNGLIGITFSSFATTIV